MFYYVCVCVCMFKVESILIFCLKSQFHWILFPHLPPPLFSFLPAISLSHNNNITITGESQRALLYIIATWLNMVFFCSV